MPPGAGHRELEPHVHADEDDSFYIRRNAGDVPVRMINVHAPAGFDRRIGLED